jgi:hypothetical protein
MTGPGEASEYYQPQPQSQAPVPLPAWQGPRILNQGSPQMERGGYLQGGQRLDQGPYQPGWRHDGRKQWNLPAWNGQYPQAPPPYANIYFNGTSPGNYDPSRYGPGVLPGPEFAPAHASSQPWFMTVQNSVSHPVYPVYAERVPPGGFVHGPGVMMPPGPPIPANYHAMSQPPLPPPPVMNHTLPEALQHKQMSVEARPFVPGQSPDMGNLMSGGAVIAQPEVFMVQPETTVITPPAWGSDGSDNGLPVPQPAATMAPHAAPVIVAHGGGGSW